VAKRLKKKSSFLALSFTLIGLMGIVGQGLAESVVVDSGGTWLRLTNQSGKGPKPKLILYTTMASWCVACKTVLPQFRYLRTVFKPEELGMFGVPYDDKEGPAQLKAWVAANGPPYDLLTDLTKGTILSIKTMVIKTLRFNGVPATIVTDGNGDVLHMRWGPPSVSDLRELLWAQNESVQH
jgi:hypothetical protein